jgi:hypothetical protein
VAPLQLGGLRGKQSTPSDWLGGTGVVSMVGERERHGKEWHGVRSHHSRRELRQRYDLYFCRLECVTVCWDRFIRVSRL